jgi:hypothetical protein
MELFAVIFTCTLSGKRTFLIVQSHHIRSRPPLERCFAWTSSLLHPPSARRIHAQKPPGMQKICRRDFWATVPSGVKTLLPNINFGRCSVYGAHKKTLDSRMNLANRA